ncbi:MAG: glycoside hydrolase family 5 protein [Asticcacaulis sp.]
MQVGRRQILASTVAVLALGTTGCGGGSSSSTPASPPPPPPPPPPPSSLYPSYNTSPAAADSTGMTSTAVDIAAKIKLGWNIGNTLEATGGETGWGNPMITQALVNKIKALGFEAVRLPCAWDQYANQTTAKISDSWLNRVKDVVQYCINADLYVLLNIHWDGGWLENHVDAASKDAVSAKQKAYWEQIATHMRDFDERLMFASANEPNAEKAAQAEVLMAYHETFINAVRSTGGKNAYRVLVVQAPNTSTELAVSLWEGLPADTVANRLMLESHNYTPFQFIALDADADWGKMFYYWGKDHHSTIEPDRNSTFGEEAYMDEQMAAMKTHFTSQGIPVLMGEYGAYRRASGPKDMATHNASVTHWMKYVTQQAYANGVLPFYWDTGGLLDRHTLAIKDQDSLDAMLQAVGKA